MSDAPPTQARANYIKVQVHGPNLPDIAPQAPRILVEPAVSVLSNRRGLQ